MTDKEANMTPPQCSPDIIERLRDATVVKSSGFLPSRKLYSEAADEIEALRHDVDRYAAISTELADENERLRAPAQTSREAPCFQKEPGGDWYIRNGDGSEHRLLDLAPNLEREALKDPAHVRSRHAQGAPVRVLTKNGWVDDPTSFTSTPSEAAQGTRFPVDLADELQEFVGRSLLTEPAHRMLNHVLRALRGQPVSSTPRTSGMDQIKRGLEEHQNMTPVSSTEGKTHE